MYDNSAFASGFYLGQNYKSGESDGRRKGFDSPGRLHAKKLYSGRKLIKIGSMKAVNVIRVRFKTLADRKSRARLSDDKRLASGEATKRELQAENSCFSSAADYRIASNRSVYAHV